MAQYLLSLYPQALLTANLRNEIPLFPAVRSGNLDLVSLFIQAWPKSGQYILQNASVDDNIVNWEPDIVELLLRGAANALDGCSILEGRENPLIRLPPDSQIITVVAPEKEGKKKKKKNKGQAAESDMATSQSEAQQAVTDGSAASTRDLIQEQQWTCVAVAATAASASPEEPASATPRSKSPILKAKERSKKRALDMPSMFLGERKRARPSNMYNDLSWQSHDLLTCYCCHSLKLSDHRKTFIPLHTALDCKSSVHMTKYIINNHQADLQRKDDQGRYPLHIAMANCRQADMVDLVLDKLLTPQAALVRDIHNRLPLHIAIACQADVRVIEALLQVNPESGVEKCQTNDEWRDRTPLHMACDCDCDLATVYRLLRADPSVLQSADSKSV
jgi:hypothetical protein